MDYHPMFPSVTIAFHPSWLLPSLQFQTCFRLKHCRPHSRGSRIDGEGTLFIDLPWDIHFWNVVPSHHLVHHTRSVTDFAGHLVYRIHGSYQHLYFRLDFQGLYFFLREKCRRVEESFKGRILALDIFFWHT